jgi:hypothetical protein
MSARSNPRGEWADSGELLWDETKDGKLKHEGEVMFDEVPLGNGDTVRLIVQTGLNDRGSVVILGLLMDKPINARRLKGIPLEAVRNECERIITWNGAGVAATIDFIQDPDDDMPIWDETRELAVDKLSRLGITDRNSAEFLALVAEVVRDARARGGGGWNAVAKALTDSDGIPISRASAQRYMKRARESGHEMGLLSRSTDNVKSFKDQIER